jgi:hypothetical protein
VIIEKDHASEDFLFDAQTDCGKKRSDVVAEKLMAMNPFVTISKI